MDTQSWLVAAKSLLRLLLGNPQTTIELYVTAALAWCGFVIVHAISGKALGLAQATRLTSAVVSVVGLGIIMAGMIAARLYFPGWQHEAWRIWTLVASGVLVGLIIVVPVTCWIQKGGYIGALMTWVLASLAAALIIVLTGGIFDGVAGGRRGAEKGKLHREQIEKVLE